MKHFLVCILFALFAIAASAQPKNDAKDPYTKIVDSLTKLGQTEKLVSFLQKEVKTKPKNAAGLRWLGYLSITDGKPDEGLQYYRRVLAIYPVCSHCYTNMARAMVDKGDLKQARILHDSAITVSPNDAFAYAARGQFLDETGDKTEALFDYNKAIAIDPAIANYYILRGENNAMQGAKYLALSDMEKAIELEPANYRPYYERARVYYELHMPAETLADLSTALRLDSSQEQIYVGRGDFFAAQGEPDKAIADYTKAIQLDPRDGFAYYERATEKYAMEDMDGYCADLVSCDSLCKKYDPKSALATDTRIAVSICCDVVSPGYYYERGFACYKKNQFADAVRIYSEGIAKFPENCMLLEYRGNAYLAEEEYAKALKDFEDAFLRKDHLAADIRLSKQGASCSEEDLTRNVKGLIAETQLGMAKTKIDLGRYKEALPNVDSAMVDAPQMKEIYKKDFLNVRGTILMGLGRYAEAVTEFDAAIAADATYQTPYINRAIAKVYQHNNSTSLGTPSVSTSLKGHGLYTNWTLPLASNVSKTGNEIASALDDCDKAILIDPSFSYTWYIRGQIKEMLDYANYCDDLEKAKELGYPVDAEVMKDCRK